MIRKILLFTIAILGVVSCSKSNDNNSNGENSNNNLLIGTWVGNVEVIAEKPDQQAKVSELFKKTYGAIFGSPETNFSVYQVKIVFDAENLKITNVGGQVILNEASYITRGNQIINKNDNTPLAIYSIENNRLIAENTSFFYPLVNNIGDLREKYLEEFQKLDQKDPKYIEKTLEIQKKYNVTLYYKYKYNLTRQ